MAWYNSNWQFRKKITVPAAAVSANLTDYPVYLNLANLGSNFFDNVKTDGSDIRMTLGDQVTELPVEIVIINTATDVGEMYFKAVGTLLTATANDFYIYYGNPAASAYAATATFGRNNVWDSNFKLVAHLQQDPSGGAPQMTDSTVNGNNGTSSGSMTTGDSVAAVASNGLDFDGTNDFINFGNAASLKITSALTAECFLKGASDNQRGFFGKGNTGNTNLSWWINTDTNSGVGRTDIGITSVSTAIVSGNSKIYRGGSQVFDNTNFNHLAFTFTSNTLLTYVNGVSDTGSRTQVWNGTVTTLNDTNETLKFGGSIIGSTSAFKSFIGDEVRISDIVRSAAWLKATTDNLKTPASFYTVGLQEVDPPTLIDLNPDLNSADNAFNTNLSLTFSKTVTPATGNVSIFEIPNLQIGGAFDGKIGEILLSNENLSLEDRQRAEGYLAWKWFGSVNPLPISHPYKYRGPSI